MSLKINEFTNSNYFVGITGKINSPNPNNDYGDDFRIFLILYDKVNDEYYTKFIKNESRIINKEIIIDNF